MGAVNVLLFSTNNDPVPVSDTLAHYVHSKQLQFGKRIGWHSAHNTTDRVREIEASQLVFIWNGNDPGGRWLARLCRSLGKDHLFVEWGLLPQAGFFHIDPGGIVGDSTLCEELDWVTEEHVAAYEAFRSAHLAARNWSYRGDPQNYVLVPLQIEHDSAVYLHSPVHTNHELLERAVREYPDREVVARPHPKQLREAVDVPGVRVERERSTMDLAQDAGLVFGMTSTVLLETAMLGAPTVAIGRCPLACHASDVNRLLAACFARQIPRSTTALDPWLNAFGVEL